MSSSPTPASAGPTRAAATAALGLLAALLLSGTPASAWATPATQTPPPPPAELFVGPGMLQGVSVSPSGDSVALLVPHSSGRRALALIGLARPEETRLLAAVAGADVSSVRWVNDDRLVFEAFEPDIRVREGGAGTFAVDREGKDVRQLISWSYTTTTTGTRLDRRILPYGWFVLRTLDDGSDDVLVWRAGSDGYRDGTVVTQVARLDTKTAQLRTISAGMPGPAYAFVLDRNKDLRVVQTSRDGKETLHWRAPGSDTWVALEEAEWFGDNGLQPLLLEDDNELIVASTRGRDTTALFSYRLDQRRLDPEPIVAIDGFDVEPRLVSDSRTQRLLGVRTSAAGPVTLWFDARLAQIQQTVDAALPKGRSNTLLCGRCESARHFAVISRSDSHPGELLHYDAERRSLRRLGSMRPELPEAGQGRRSFHRFAARDGLSIPVVVTHPAGSRPDQPLPAVVLVHGGPWVRGSDTSWSAWPQFLASRGYRVLEVEYRGSTGFGWRHFQAGWQQWGLAMQDDLADALQWAAGQKLVDAGRACIVGASYGGYAALIGPIRHPQAWRCAASHVGVTDIELLFTSWRSDMSRQARRFSLPTLVGDRERDAERLRATSPLQRVGEIRVPLLVTQGGFDRRVPREHYDRFVSAARAARVPIETHLYNDGHGFFYDENEADYLRRLEAFLARSLKQGAP
jgi:dipeptidyl aminopeptidase/acylaminoacyl peptidase